MEYCAAKVLNEMCRNLEEAITEGTFNRFTFDMMLAWETPSSSHEESHRVRMNHDFHFHFHSYYCLVRYTLGAKSCSIFQKLLIPYHLIL